MVSSPDGRAITTLSSCLESLRRFMLLDEEHDGSVWKKSSAPTPTKISVPTPTMAEKQKKKILEASSSHHHQQQQHSNSGSNSAKQDFLKAVSFMRDHDMVVSDPERLPPLEAAYVEFLRTFPRFSETLDVDDLRAREYAHLCRRVCLDYSGFGLFSHLQIVADAATSSFRLAYVSANLPTQALYGTRPGHSLEGRVRRKIMDHFRLSDADYSMVFTASKGTAVRLLAESYRFDLHPRLLTTYDHHSQSIEWLIACARDRGAKISSVRFRWPSLRICSKDLRKQLSVVSSSSKSKTKGLFVFPLQSRVTGARYSHQWIPFAQEKQWQVLLDASALGPRDMDAVGLSVFRPDFIVSSFYKVFGADPSGFGCLFIKRSAIQSLSNSSRARSVGMVRLLPSSHQDDDVAPVLTRDDGEAVRGAVAESDQNPSSFSGPLSVGEEILVSDEQLQRSSTFADSLSRSASDRGARDPEQATDEASAEKNSLQLPGSPARAGDADGGVDPSTSMENDAHSPRGYSPRQLVDIKGKRKLVEEVAECSRRNEFPGADTSPPKIRSLLELIRDETGDPEDPPPRKRSLVPPPPPPRITGRLVELLHSPSVRDNGEEEEQGDELGWIVCCKALEQTKLLGMINIQNRLRCLITWLLLSLLKLQHHGLRPLVKVYGPSGNKYNRGASMAFNLYDWEGLLLQPALVQRLADRNSISLGLADIKNIKFVDGVQPDIAYSVYSSSPRRSNSSCGPGGVAAAAAAGSSCQESGCSEFRVVTLALSYVSSFEDVYRVWEFVAKFLDADFVNKEVWRYHTINQQIVVVGSCQ